MSIPRFNKTGEGNLWVNSAPADASFTTGIELLHDSNAAVEVVYTGLDAADATVRLKASNSNDVDRARNLTAAPSTLTTANSSYLFNIEEANYGYLHLVYDSGSNSAGSVYAYVVRKQRS